MAVVSSVWWSVKVDDPLYFLGGFLASPLSNEKNPEMFRENWLQYRFLIVLETV